MKRIIQIKSIVLLCSIFMIVFPAWSQDEQNENEWTGKLKDGTVINEKDLKAIVNEYERFFDGDGEESKLTDLNGANLIGANLSGAILSDADLYGADLSRSNLRKAKLYKANLRRTQLRGADLREADLSYTNLRDANFSHAELSHTYLIGADLRGSNLEGASLIGTFLLKANLKKAKLIRANMRDANLWSADLKSSDLRQAKLTFADLSGADLRKADLRGADLYGARLNEADLREAKGLPELREKFKKSGSRDMERFITYYIKLTEWENLALGDFFDKIEAFLYLIFFDFTCKYGISTIQPLIILMCLIPYFAIFYLVSLETKNGKAGIWLVCSRDRVLKGTGKQESYRLTAKFLPKTFPTVIHTKLKLQIFRLYRMIRISLYFSLLSAFSIGWREFNVASWIRSLQRREYVLRPAGWVRTLSGIQSLLSAYLLVLWALTYFGRPF